MKLLEHMSMKMATVASAVGENRYVIDHGRTGFFATSPEEWANCLEKLIVNDDLQREMGENAYCKIKSTYSLPAVVNTLERVVREIAEAVGYYSPAYTLGKHYWPLLCTTNGVAPRGAVQTLR